MGHVKDYGGKNGKNDWDEIYRKSMFDDIPWHTVRPKRRLVEIVKRKDVTKGVTNDSALDMGP